MVTAKATLLTAAGTTIAWVLATFVTRPEPMDKLVAFYRRVHPSVYGWQPVARLVPELPPVRDLGANTLNWVMGCVLVYGAMFGIGKFVFKHWSIGAALLALSAAAGYLIFWRLSRQGWETFSGVARAAKTQGTDPAET